MKRLLKCYSKVINDISIDKKISMIKLNNLLTKSAENKFELKQFNDAISDCTKILATSPNNIKVHLFRIKCFKKLKHLDKAIEDCTDLERLCKHDKNDQY